MPRRIAILVLFACLALAGSAVAKVTEFEVRQVGNLRVKLGAEYTPHRLPRRQPAPISVEVAGAISTTDGSHPPALRWLELSVNRKGRISTAGLPICTSPQLQSTTTEQALARCRGARVGRGGFRAQLALGGEKDIPAAGHVLAFNSRRNGRPALLLHLFIGVPVRVTMIIPITIGHREEGQFGTILRARIPKLGGGLGSVTEIDLQLGRRYKFRGKGRSYLSAACGAPSGLPGAVFPLLRGSFRFEAHPQIEEPVVKDCTVAGV